MGYDLRRICAWSSTCHCAHGNVEMDPCGFAKIPSHCIHWTLLNLSVTILTPTSPSKCIHWTITITSQPHGNGQPKALDDDASEPSEESWEPLRAVFVSMATWDHRHCSAFVVVTPYHNPTWSSLLSSSSPSSSSSSSNSSSNIFLSVYLYCMSGCVWICMCEPVWIVNHQCIKHTIDHPII